jgi:hypothetical protein
MTKYQAVANIKNCLETLRAQSNQYGVPEWKFQKVLASVKLAENSLSILECAAEMSEGPQPATNKQSKICLGCRRH